MNPRDGQSPLCREYPLFVFTGINTPLALRWNCRHVLGCNDPQYAQRVGLPFLKRHNNFSCGRLKWKAVLLSWLALATRRGHKIPEITCKTVRKVLLPSKLVYLLKALQPRTDLIERTLGHKRFYG